MFAEESLGATEVTLKLAHDGTFELQHSLTSAQISSGFALSIFRGKCTKSGAEYLLQVDAAEYATEDSKFTRALSPFGSGFVRESEKVISPTKLADSGSYDFLVPPASLRLSATLNAGDGKLNVRIPCIRVSAKGDFSFHPETRALQK